MPDFNQKCKIRKGVQEKYQNLFSTVTGCLALSAIVFPGTAPPTVV